MSLTLPGTGGLALPAGSTAPTPIQSDNSTTLATTAFVKTAVDAVNSVAASAVTPSSLRTEFNVSGTAPLYACRAWVNFNAVQLGGNYSQSGTTVTITTSAAHELAVGQMVGLTFAAGTSGTPTAPVNGFVVQSVISATQFTVISANSLPSNSGTVTRNWYIRGQGNIASITYNGVGDFTLNFATAMPDGNYSLGSSVGALDGTFVVCVMMGVPTASSCRIRTLNWSPVVVNLPNVTVSFFR